MQICNSLASDGDCPPGNPQRQHRSEFAFEIPIQNWRAEPLPSGEAPALEAGCDGAAQPRFPRLLQALEETRLSEHRSSSGRSGRPALVFRRFEHAIAERGLGLDLSPEASIIEPGGEGRRSWRPPWRALPTHSWYALAVVAGIAVAIAGGPFMVRLAATSPAEIAREAVSASVLVKGNSLPAPQAIVGGLVEASALVPEQTPSETNAHSDLASAEFDVQPDEDPVILPSRTIVLPTEWQGQHSAPRGPETNEFGEVASVISARAAELVSAEATLKPEDLSAAEESLERLSENRPSQAASAYDRGYALQQQQQYGDALASYQVAIELEPRAAHIHYNIGVVLSKLGRLEEADAAFERASTLNPVNAYAFYDWGWVLERAGDVEGAREKYQVVLEIGAETTAANNARKRLASLHR